MVFGLFVALISMGNLASSKYCVSGVMSFQSRAVAIYTIIALSLSFFFFTAIPSSSRVINYLMNSRPSNQSLILCRAKP